MEKTQTAQTRRPTTRRELIAERDRLVAELRYTPANGVPAREVGGRFIGSAEVAERVEAISRLNAAIKAAEESEKSARERRAAEEARRAADLALKARKGQQRAAAVVAAYRAHTPQGGVRQDRTARKAAVNGWDQLVGSYNK